MLYQSKLEHPSALQSGEKTRKKKQTNDLVYSGEQNKKKVYLSAHVCDNFLSFFLSLFQHQQRRQKSNTPIVRERKKKHEACKSPTTLRFRFLPSYWPWPCLSLTLQQSNLFSFNATATKILRRRIWAIKIPPLVFLCTLFHWLLCTRQITRITRGRKNIYITYSVFCIIFLCLIMHDMTTSRDCFENWKLHFLRHCVT